MSALYAVRVAAKLRRELQTGVEMVRGHYGEFKVLVDGETVVDGGFRVTLGVMPPAGEVVATVRQRLAEPAPPARST